MRCHRCRARYAANIMVQVAPGGQCSPGVFLLVALVGGVLALMDLLLLRTMVLFAVGAAAFLVAIVQVPVAMWDCSGDCPRCGVRRRIRPWSW